jgi:hypothetical protein
MVGESRRDENLPGAPSWQHLPLLKNLDLVQVEYDQQ